VARLSMPMPQLRGQSKTKVARISKVQVTIYGAKIIRLALIAAPETCERLREITLNLIRLLCKTPRSWLSILASLVKAIAPREPYLFVAALRPLFKSLGKSPMAIIVLAPVSLLFEKRDGDGSGFLGCALGLFTPEVLPYVG